jgi:hypothetical protein
MYCVLEFICKVSNVRTLNHFVVTMCILLHVCIYSSIVHYLQFIIFLALFFPFILDYKPVSCLYTQGIHGKYVNMYLSVFLTNQMLHISQ